MNVNEEIKEDSSSTGSLIYPYVCNNNSNSACNKRGARLHHPTNVEMNFNQIPPPIAPILHLRICLPANNSPAPSLDLIFNETACGTAYTYTHGNGDTSA